MPEIPISAASHNLFPASGFRVTFTVCVAILACFLCMFFSPVTVLAMVVGAAMIWVVFRYPIAALGILLAQMPFNYLAVVLGQFLGLPHMVLISAFKEIALVLIICILWWKNGLHPIQPDWFLAGFVAIAAVHTALGGGIIKGLQYDTEFALPYLAGRFAILSSRQEEMWARCAVWIVAIVSVLGMAEVFFLGPGPRTILYTALTDEDELTSPYHAVGFSGLRASSTMVGPLEFAALCMVGLILWWVYSRNPIPAGLIAAGLICAVTRSATLGTTASISIVAYRLKQGKRLLAYSIAAVILLLAAIPIVGLRDYMSVSAKGEDLSAQTHRSEILDGIEYVVSHPLGTGPGSVGPLAFAKYSNALQIEDTYLAFSAQYGVLAAVCFLGFLWSAFRLLWGSKTQLGYAASGILVGFCMVMVVLLIHQDIRLACWVWFPVGLAVRAGSR